MGARLPSTGASTPTVRLVKRGDEVGYRAEANGEIVGYYRALMSAVKAAHMAHVRGMGPQGAANGGANGWDMPLDGRQSAGARLTVVAYPR